MMHLNRLLTRHKIVELNDLSPEDEMAIFALLRPLQGMGEAAKYLESQVDRGIEVVRLGGAVERIGTREAPGSAASQHEDRPPPDPRRCVQEPEHYQKEDGEPMPAILDTPLMNTRDAARYLGISGRQLQYEVSRGRITVVRLNRNLRFTERSLRSFIEQHTIAAKDAV